MLLCVCVFSGCKMSLRLEEYIFCTLTNSDTTNCKRLRKVIMKAKNFYANASTTCIIFERKETKIQQMYFVSHSPFTNECGWTVSSASQGNYSLFVIPAVSQI